MEGIHLDRVRKRFYIEAMEARQPKLAPCGAPFRLLEPEARTVPVVAASPHSGTCYPEHFLKSSRLDAQTLRRSEDTYVDELFGLAPTFGVPLLCAVYPRAYLDLNREPYELDPAMFFGTLPPYVNTGSSRVAAGLGTIARDVADGEEIYAGKLSFSEIKDRIDTLYRPYHDCLIGLIDGMIARFRYCILLDCHSMPTTGDRNVADVVLGDRHGLSCSPVLTSHVAAFLGKAGLRVVHNTPYAGGHTTGFYGSPRYGVHALQIEIARRLYMDEETHERLPALAALRTLMGRLVQSVGHMPEGAFLPPGTP